jgi:c-di-GMP-binding flagellar brake protein YcgR
MWDIWTERHGAPACDARSLELRREKSRITVDSLAMEISSENEHPVLLVDVSENGLRLERPLAGGRRSRIVQVEFDIPGYDDLIWASGEVCFDHLWRKDRRLVRTTGLRFLRAAERHLRVLHEFIVETRRIEDRQKREQDWWLRATALQRG